MNKRLRQALVAEPGQVSFETIIASPFPDYVARRLEDRYENVFCTMARVPEEVLQGAASAYVAYDGESPGTIILYRQQGRRITVLNDYLSLRCEELEGMARHLFEEHPSVDVVCLASVAMERKPLAYPSQRFNATEDLVITLPRVTEDYFSALGPNTRSAIRKCQKFVAATKPPVEFVFYDKGTVGIERIEQLVELSRLRITSKNEVPRHTEGSIAQLWRMVDAYGLTLVARMEGKIVGGVICTHVGKHVYMHVITHDRGFDAARLGLLCCYLSICEAIRRGAHEYHLLSGKYDYKYRLRGVQLDYDKVLIYRSPNRVLSSIGLFISTSIRGHGRRAKQRLVSWRKRWIR